MRHRVPPDVLLLVTVLFWSFNFTVVKYALTDGWLPLAFSSVRFAIGALLFSGFTYAREGSLVRYAAKRVQHRIDAVDCRQRLPANIHG